PSLFSNHCKSKLPPRIGARQTWTVRRKRSTRDAAAFSETTIVVRAAKSSETRFAAGGVRASESRIMRRRRARFAPFNEEAVRSVSFGLSSKTVFTPTNTASAARRRAMAWFLAAAFVIHL